MTIFIFDYFRINICLSIIFLFFKFKSKNQNLKQPFIFYKKTKIYCKITIQRSKIKIQKKN